MNILIAGCGYVGTRLAQILIKKDHLVHALRRTPSAHTDRGIHWITGDICQPKQIQTPAAIEVLILAAGLRRDAEARYQQLFSRGYPELIRQMQSTHPIKRVLMVSTTGVFAETDGGWVDEKSPVDHELMPGRYYLQAEKYAINCGTRGVVARLSGIYGPDRVRLIREVRDGEALTYPPPPHYLNQIHADDAAGALAHLVDLPEPESLYIVSDREPSDRNDVIRWLAARLGKPVPAQGTNESRPARRAGNKRCASHRLAASGYTFRYPSFREGYAALLEGTDAV